MVKYFHPGLTKAQREAFEQIAVGNDEGVNPKVADVLIKKGLVERFGVAIGKDNLGTISIYRYAVPLNVHIEWCAWCADNVTDEMEEQLTS